MKKHIPNIITCCNLLSGTMAVLFATREDFFLAFVFILIGAFFDFFDGMSARALHVGQPIGKELDSLADVITFGLAPTIMLFVWLFPVVSWWSLLCLPMVAFSAIRLAKFNLDERQTSSFLGLATPPNAIFWGSLLSYLSCAGYRPLWLCIVFIVGSIASSILLVSEIPFFSLKFHDLKWSNNKVRFVFIIVSVLLLCATVIASAVIGWYLLCSIGAVVIIWYILLSLITYKSIS